MIAVWLVLLLAGGVLRAGRFETAVTPLPNEDIESACHYKLNMEPRHPILPL